MLGCFLSHSAIAQICEYEEIDDEPWFDSTIETFNADYVSNGDIWEVFAAVYVRGGTLSNFCEDPAISSLVFSFRVYTEDLANGQYQIFLTAFADQYYIAGSSGFQSTSSELVPPNNSYETHTGTFEVNASTPDQICLELQILPKRIPFHGGTAVQEFQVSFVDHTGTMTDTEHLPVVGAQIQYNLVRQVVAGDPIRYSEAGDIDTPPDPAVITTHCGNTNVNTTSSTIRVEGHLILDEPEYCIFGSQSSQQDKGFFFQSDSKVTLEQDVTATSIREFYYTTPCPDETWDGFYLEDGATLDMTDAIIENWSTGIVAGDNCTVSLTNCSITSIVDWDGIVMGDNASLTIDNSTLEKIGDKIQLGANSTLTVVNETKIENTASGQSIEWNGIQVGPNSTVVFDKATVRQAQTGLMIAEETPVNMDNTALLYCETGVDITDSDFLTFDNNVIAHGTTGIKAFDSDGLGSDAEINHASSSSLDNATRIYDLEDAVVSEGNWEVANLKIYQVSQGVENRNSSRSSIESCQINADRRCIRVYDAYINISENHLGNPQYGAVGDFAITMGRCPESIITRNPYISGDTRAFLVWSSDKIRIEHNSNMTSIGAFIQSWIVSSNSVRFIDNYVNTDASIAGVRISRSHNMYMQNNGITAMQARDVVSVTASSSFTSDNTNDGGLVIAGGSQSDGFDLKNSVQSTLRCHNVDVGRTALRFDKGSGSTQLFTNTLQGGEWDLHTSAVLGRQRDMGNCFLGDRAAAPDLSDEEIDMSRFEHLAGVSCYSASVAPDGLFVDEGVAEPTCGFDGGNGIVSPEEVCAVVKLLEAKHKSNPERYFIDMMHLLTYYMRDTSLTLPKCISRSIETIQPCGLVEVATLLEREYSLSRGVDHKAEADKEVKRGEEAASEGEREAAMSATLGSTALATGSRATTRQREDSIYTTIQRDLQKVDCDEKVPGAWVDVFSILVEVMLADSLAASQIPVLQEYARLCASDYGDPIHWARDLLGVFADDQTDYSVYDDCTAVEKRSASPTTVSERAIALYPNPSTGVVNISGIDGVTKATVRVFAVSGELMQTVDLTNGRKQVDLTELAAGVYLVEVQADASASTHKLIIAK